MSLWKIAWRSIQQRALASALTALSMALGVSLVVAVLVVHSVVYQAFHRGGEGYDLVVGPAKGSRLELVLNAVYYMGQPIDPMPYEYYKKLHDGLSGVEASNRPFPSAWATSYEDFPVVGTTPDLFDRDRVSGRAELPVCRGAEFQGRELHRGRHRRHRGPKDRPQGRRRRRKAWKARHLSPHP